MPRSGSQDRNSPTVAITRNVRIGSGRECAAQAKTPVAAIMPMMVREATAGVVSGWFNGVVILTLAVIYGIISICLIIKRHADFKK